MGLLNGVLRISEYASVVNIIQCHFGFLKYFFKAFLSHLLLSKKQNPDSLYHPSPSPSAAPALVSLIFPVSARHESIAASVIKEKLSVAEYNRVAERLKNENIDDGDEEEEEPRCAVCLDNLEAGQEVRELHNCCHVYHKQCLDAWVERGHVTCPLCRVKLLAADDHMRHREEEEVEPRDPWRSERMMYLFGEDVIF